MNFLESIHLHSAYSSKFQSISGFYTVKLIINFPGCSSGALVNSNGELIGIVNSKLVGFGVEGIAFCIPSKYLFEMLNLEYN